MIRIFCDFTHADDQGRMILHTVGALEDIQLNEAEMIEGSRVILYTPGDVEVEGELIFEDGIWLGIPDYTTVRDL
jgi:hypothetical protein